MHDDPTFEARLAAALQRRADAAPVDIDASAVAHAVAASIVRSAPFGITFDRRARGGARLIVLAALLALVVAALLVLSTRLRPSDRLLGRLVPTGPMTVEREGHTATLLADGRVLVVGGDDPPSADIYDPATGTFTRTGTLTTQQRFGMATAALPDGGALVVGGWDMMGSGSVTDWPIRFGETYDAASGTFRRTADLAQARGYLWSALALPDGRIMIAGGEVPDAPAGATGSDSNRHLADVEFYDPSSGEFARGGPLLSPRSAHTLTLLADGRVLVAGGWGPEGPLATAEVYDPSTGTSTPTSAMTTGRAYHATVALADGRVLLIGGDGPDAGHSALDSIDVFDPVTGTFAPAGRLISERSGPTAVRLMEGRVLVAGGNNRDGDPRSVEVFDPVAGTSEVVGRIEPGQDVGNSFSVTTTLLGDGTVLIAGGNGAQAERFYPTLPPEPARAAASPPTPVNFAPVDGPGALRTGHTATRLADGRVLIAGGTDGGTSPILASAEIFDPVTGRSSPTGPMGAPRSGHAAALLADGRVLVAGGLQDADTTQPWPSAELYDPVTGLFAPTGAMTAQSAPRSGSHSGPRHGHPAAVTLPDGRVFIADWDPASADDGGGSAQIYDPASDAFTATTALGGSADGEARSAILLPDGRVLVLVGTHVDPTVQALIYDPATETWEAAGSAMVGEAFSATLLPDGRVLVAGGVAYHGAGTTAAARIWDAATGTFTDAGDMAAARAGHAATLLADGRVLVSGGFFYSRDQSAQVGPIAPEVWDPRSGLFSPAGTMVSERSGSTATLLADGRVLIIGGVKRPPDRSNLPPPFAELYVGP